MLSNRSLNTPISFNHFLEVELRVGTIIDVKPFDEARKPAYKLWVDFGSFGIKKSSAQLTVNYTLDELIGKQIIGVINFEPKQIAGFISEFLVTGFEDTRGNIVLAQPQCKVPDGGKLL